MGPDRRLHRVIVRARSVLRSSYVPVTRRCFHRGRADHGGVAVSNEFPAGRAEPAAPPPTPGWRPGIALSGLIGIVALGLTLAVAELLSAAAQLGWLNPASSPLGSLGQTFIALTPEWLKQFAISTFGTNDKTALLVGMGLTLLVVGFVIGVVGRDRPRVAVGIAGILVVVTAVAILARPGSSV